MHAFLGSLCLGFAGASFLTPSEPVARLTSAALSPPNHQRIIYKLSEGARRAKWVFKLWGFCFLPKPLFTKPDPAEISLLNFLAGTVIVMETLCDSLLNVSIALATYYPRTGGLRATWRRT